MLALSSIDRLLIFAPHPDDESLATGAIIQRAFAAGAALRIVFATSGDNNPWPQRVMERRWRLSLNDRARWGLLRRREARAAVARLGGDESHVTFLNFPDQGLTRLLMRGSESAVHRLAVEIVNWHPTVILMPAAHDDHADHSALHLLVRFALDLAGVAAARVFEYLVHAMALEHRVGRAGLVLTPHERATKRAAILEHRSQIALSYKRFTAFARDWEFFSELSLATDPPPIDAIRLTQLVRGTLRVVTRVPLFRRSTLLVAGESLSDGAFRWSLRLPPWPRMAGCVPLRNEMTRGYLRRATVRRCGILADVRLPISTLFPLHRLYVRVATRALISSWSAWQAVPVSESSSLLAASSGRTTFQSVREIWRQRTLCEREKGHFELLHPGGSEDAPRGSDRHGSGAAAMDLH